MKTKYRKNKFAAIRNLKCSLFWFFDLFLLILNVYFAIQISSMGVQMYMHEEKIRDLDKSVNLLSNELVSLNSLVNLEKSSSDLGFVQPEKFIYIQSGSSTFAKAQ